MMCVGLANQRYARVRLGGDGTQTGAPPTVFQMDTASAVVAGQIATSRTLSAFAFTAATISSL